MKTISGILRTTAYLLTLLILCHSCTIYRSKNISLDEAIETQSKVRVKTTSNRDYTFKRIEKNEAVTYGIAGRNSKAGKQLVSDILPENVSNYLVKIQLDENIIQEINPKNKSMTAIVGIIIGLAAFVSILAVALSNMAFLP